MMLAFVWICWNANSNTAGGVIRFCGWAPTTGKLSLPQMHLGVLTADVQKAHRETEREREGGRINKPRGESSPGNWCYLIAHGRPENQWGEKKIKHLNNCLNQGRFTRVSKKPKTLQLQYWREMLHPKGGGSNGSPALREMLWMNNCIPLLTPA